MNGKQDGINTIIYPVYSSQDYASPADKHADNRPSWLQMDVLSLDSVLSTYTNGTNNVATH